MAVHERLSPPVEAESLSNLHDLAQYPPKYPKNPSKQRRQTVTLYISRVPGTRDIVLNTRKPHEKNVSGGDVIDSLYYVHVDVSPDLPSRRAKSKPASGDNKLPRKPVGGFKSAEMPAESSAAQVAEEAQHEPKSTGTADELFLAQNDRTSDGPSRNVLPLIDTGDLVMSGMPDGVTQDPRVSSDTSPTTAFVPDPDIVHKKPARKPVGPRPMSTSIPSSAIDATAIPPVTQPEAPKTTRLSESAHPLEPLFGNQVHRSPSPEGPAEPPSYQVTLRIIRRDATGNQSNVAWVSLQQGRRPSNSSDNTSRNLAMYPAMDIEIENPGYLEFTKRLPIRMTQGEHSSAEELIQPFPNTDVFTRPMIMLYEKTLSSSMMTRFGNRSRSQSAVAAPDPNGGRDSKTLTKQPGPGTKARGYNFLCPWGRRCEFLTGIAGDSVRLTLPEEAHMVYNPITSEQQTVPTFVRSVTASEMRFNLPTIPTENRRPSDADGGGNRGHASWLESHNLTAPTWKDNQHINKLINLGRERAGGGMKGNKAKLGKLIVEDEGQKMLDLVVAANMGLFYNAWTRNPSYSDMSEMGDPMSFDFSTTQS